MSVYAFELGYTTPPAWGDAAAADPLTLLNDHAHCELQAAVACTALIARYPDRTMLVDLATRVIGEEMVHFRRVVDLLREMGGELSTAGPNPYMDGMRKGTAGTRRSGLLDRLLLASLIERRSCERFELLSNSTGDSRLVALYSDLAPEEVLHQRQFVEAARRECLVELGAGAIEFRLEQMLAVEAAVVPTLAFSARMHSGPPIAS